MREIIILWLKKVRCIWLLISSLFIALFTGCGEYDSPPAKMYYAYFPTHPGHFIIYQVDSVVYDGFTGQVLNFQYQVMQRIHSRFTDAEGRESLRIERFYRPNSQVSWQTKDVWQARIHQGRLEKIEENNLFIKLVFPPHRGRTWNGNAYNTLPAMTFRISEAHVPLMVNPNLRFDSTVTVLQNNLVTLISEDVRRERFAKHVGMIERQHRVVRKNLAGVVTEGVDYSYRIVEYGTNPPQEIR
ncbi:MAG TPA: hypothetical protein VLH37_09640 [Bacteroidales bacterium]|nr:hypothetical protein [Bacteroidales bacterium]